MVAHCPWAEKKLVSYLFTGQAIHHQLQHFLLSLGQMNKRCLLLILEAEAISRVTSAANCGLT
ncbi:hypothetical protein VT98_10031 [Candidatus Electrothrix communis]|uniref:Uncharacterized protein n=1 Tax=Candidatus Electrothrix communis TaxID=1859133 RepID=A0A3S3R4C4_9BACT|nr:hypothetical protein VT98_10031 [Candidatus Electrothrix communis]